MKWNGSIYYNVISQDNVGVDRVALALSPCPVFPSHYWQRPWMRGAEGMQARRWIHGTGIFPSPDVPPTQNPVCHRWLRMMLKSCCTPIFLSASPFPHLSFLRPFSVIPGKTQVEMHGQAPRSRCSRGTATSYKIHILTQHKASVSPLMAHLPAAGLSSRAAK